MTDQNRADSDPPDPRHSLLGVRISPLFYEYHDDADTDACSYVNLWGVMYVQRRHLESCRMSTWN